MENYIYFVTIESYDCLIGHRSEVKGFKTLVEAWSFYKSNSKFDFDYIDHYQITNKPARRKDADAHILPKQRPHARSKEEYEKWFSYKCEPFFRFKEISNFDDVKDVEVIKQEEKYFFDNGELLF